MAEAGRQASPKDLALETRTLSVRELEPRPFDSGERKQKPLPFIPSAFQQRILNALNGKALTAANLVSKLNTDNKRLFKDGIHELRREGKIDNNRRIGGYYRPNALL